MDFSLDGFELFFFIGEAVDAVMDAGVDDAHTYHAV